MSPKPPPPGMQYSFVDLRAPMTFTQSYWDQMSDEEKAWLAREPAMIGIRIEIVPDEDGE